MRITLVIAATVLMLVACAGSKTDTTAASEPQATAASDTATWPSFSADSAYAYLARQVAFGPRVPGTAAHRNCADYLVSSFQKFGADTIVKQIVDVINYKGAKVAARNILARFNTAAPRRILLVAHYDTRPWADEDSAEANRNKPIDGANDGASGVAVILEIARLLGLTPAPIGVDFLLVDAEDMGARSDEDTVSEADGGWCLGSAAWANNLPYRPIDRPAYGILLDMVGGKDAVFTREYFSNQQAPAIVAKVWNAAKKEGVTRFVDKNAGAVTDDHINISRAGIPCIDIIECAHPATGAFPPYWHTMADNLDIISKQTLSDVGRTLMRVIYSEKPQ